MKCMAMSQHLPVKLSCMAGIPIHFAELGSLSAHRLVLINPIESFKL